MLTFILFLSLYTFGINLLNSISKKASIVSKVYFPVLLLARIIFWSGVVFVA